MLTAIMTLPDILSPRRSRCRLPKLSSGITDDFGVVCLITLASLLPFLLMLVKRENGPNGDGRFEVETLSASEKKTLRKQGFR